MEAFLWTLLWNIIIAFWIMVTIFIFSIFKKKLIHYINYITATTVGLLLWIIFIWFIPELAESELSWKHLWLFILLGLFLFYVFELFLHWHHCQDLSHESHGCHHTHAHSGKSGKLMFGGTLLHNMFHWVILFWAFSINMTFGIATTFALLLHGVPQNIVNYIMNHKKEKYAYIAAFGGIFWALLTYPFADTLLENKFFILAVITWGLLYTALADIFPEFKEKWEMKAKVSYLFFIILWVSFFFGFEEMIESGHQEEVHEGHENTHDTYSH